MRGWPARRGPDRARWSGALWLLGLVALALLSGAIADGAEIDNRIATWGLDRGDARAHALLRERFGGDEVVLVRVDDPVRVPERELRAAFEELAAAPAVRSAIDPLALASEGPGGVDGALARASARPLVRALDAVALEAEAASRVDLLLALAADADTRARAGLLEALRSFEASAAAHGARVRYAGHPLVAIALDAQARRVERVFAPLLVVAGLLLVAILLRSPTVAALTMLPAVAASLGARACLVLLGIPTNMILVAVGPLVLVLVVASALHLVLAVRRGLAAGLDSEAARARALSHARPGALLAAATTAVGFGVFAVSPVVAVRQLGVTVALAVAVAVPLAYAALPSMLEWAGSGPRPAGRFLERIPRWLGRRALRRPALALGGACVIAAAGVHALDHLPIGADSLDFFPSGHPVREHFLGLEADGGALTAVELLLPLDLEAARGPTGADLSRRLAEVDGIRSVVGPPEVAQDLRAALGPIGSALVSDSVGEALQLRAGRVGVEGTWTRWTVRAARGGAARVDELVARLEAVGADWASAWSEAAPVVGGSVARVVAMQRAITCTFALSLLGTASVCLAALAWAARDSRTLVAIAVANALPVLAVLAVARVRGLALDVATVMVASVVLGLAVDNTFHLVLAARRGRARGVGPLRSGLRAFGEVGPAASTATLSLSVGFAVLALSGFAPTARFGSLTALGVVAAFLADFYLLPVIWLGRSARRPGGSRGHAHGRRRTSVRSAPRSVAP